MHCDPGAPGEKKLSLGLDRSSTETPNADSRLRSFPPCEWTTWGALHRIASLLFEDHVQNSRSSLSRKPKCAHCSGLAKTGSKRSLFTAIALRALTNPYEISRNICCVRDEPYLVQRTMHTSRLPFKASRDSFHWNAGAPVCVTPMNFPSIMQVFRITTSSSAWKHETRCRCYVCVGLIIIVGVRLCVKRCCIVVALLF